MQKMTLLIRSILKLALICLFGLSTLNAQVEQEDWTYLHLVDFEISDKLTAGCEVPINLTIENTSDELVNTTRYELNFFIDQNEPDFPFSFLNAEFVIPIDGIVLAPNEIITLQQNLPVKEPLFDFPEGDETVLKNVVIVWGGGVAVEEDNNDFVFRNIDVTTSEFVDASLAEIDSVSFEGPINLEDFVDVAEANEETCSPFGAFQSAEILSEANEYYIIGTTLSGDFVFWSLDGNFIKCDDSSELLGPLEEIPFYLADFFQFEFGEIIAAELVEINGRVYYQVIDNTEEVDFLFDLNYELVGYDGMLFNSDLENIDEELLFFFDEDAELVAFEFLENGQVLMTFSNGYSFLLDQLGNIVYVDEPEDGDGLVGFLPMENVPVEFSDAVEDAFPSEVVSFSFVNDLNCGVTYQAAINDEIVLIFDSETSEITNVSAGTDRDATIQNRIYPNPSTGNLIITGELDEFISLEVFDVVGRKVYEQTVIDQSLVNLTQLKIGTYLVRLNSSRGSKSFSWVKL